VRATIDGPLLRWISKGEEVKIVVPPPPPPPPVPAFPNFPRPAGQAFYYAPYTTASGPMPYGQSSAAFPYALGPQGVQIPAGAYGGASNYTPAVPTPNSATAASTPTASGSTTPTFTAAPTTSASPTVTVPNASTSMQASTSQSLPVSSSSKQTLQQTPSQPLFQPTNYIHYSPQVTEAITASAGAMPPPVAPPEPQPTERIEKMARNYVVHELSQHEGVPMPQWTETMTAMFGGYVKWDEVKVYVGKNRPLCMYFSVAVVFVSFLCLISNICLNSPTETDMSHYGEVREVSGSPDGSSILGCEGV
jgi:vacuolar protein sorting-associated protein 72